MTIASNPRWRDPVPASIERFAWNTVVKVPKPIGPHCKGCKTATISEAYAPYCSSFCQASWNAIEGARVNR